MQVLLTTLNAKYIHINLAIRLLYQLNKSNAGLKWREFTIKESALDIAQQCADFEVVAFSCYIWNITQTLAVAKCLKSLKPEIKILLGGSEVSYEWEEIIALEFVDFIILGEGETPFSAFLQNYPVVENVPGLVYKQESEIKQNPLPPLFDLKKFADIMPYIDDPVDEIKNKVAYVETSRGCPYKCEFCLASLDNKVRYLPDQNIQSTLLYLMKHGKVIKFLDRTFNIKKNFTLEMFDFILKNHQPQNVFQFEITADILHPDIIQFIKDFIPAGLFRFEIGIQTVNQQANLAVSRKQNFDKTKEIILSLSDKIEMHLDLIVGLPLDYWDDIKFSIEVVFKLFAPELQLGFLKFLKGTPLRDKHQNHGFIYDPQPPYQIIESNYLSKNQLTELLFLEHALEIYWNKNRTPLTLKYIATQASIFDFLMGLGTFFKQQKGNEQYSLKDVYHLIFDYSKLTFPNDSLLLQFITLDYALQNKVKQAALFLPEVDKKEQQKIIQKAGLNAHKYRFAMIDLDFDLAHFLKTNQVLKPSSVAVIQYTGTDSPSLVFV